MATKNLCASFGPLGGGEESFEVRNTYNRTIILILLELYTSNYLE